MASPFAEAITQSMIAGLDPMNGVMRQFAQQSVQTQSIALDDAKLELIEKIETKIENCQVPSVKATYERMLARLVASI